MALEVLRKNDTLVVWKLDRLGRSVKGLVDLVNQKLAVKNHVTSFDKGNGQDKNPPPERHSRLVGIMSLFVLRIIWHDI